GRYQYSRAFNAPDCNGTPEFTVQRQRWSRRELGDPGLAGQHSEAPRSRPAGLSGRSTGAHRLWADQEPPTARASAPELEGCPRTYRTGRRRSWRRNRVSSATAAAMPLQELERPRPHQITAVYEWMLPRQPLRFLS